jgi:NhaP-type Na+/H+ or K+/H+ antiporter
MNDGTAFPFVMLGLGLLGLHELGDFGVRWILVDVLWATIAAVTVGAICGVLVARTGWKLRGYGSKHEILDDFVGLGVIAVAYGICVSIHAWGFLAVFFAGVALRQTELKLAQVGRRQPERMQFDPPGKDEGGKRPDEEPPATVSEEALVFQEHLERLSELLLVLLVGGMLFLDFWTWRTVGLALFVFIIARPVSVFIGLLATSTSWRIRGMTGWFGVRGIGSVYYLMYAIQHGLPEDIARELIHLTLIVIALSILVHGTSVKPLMNRFWRKRKR